MKKVALVLGASGLVGHQLTNFLASSKEYSKIYVLSRRELDFNHEKIDTLLVDFTQIDRRILDIDVNDIFCCIGTTIKKAKTKEAFKFVDYEIPLEVAKLLKREFDQKFILISSISADRNSKSFYLKTKGELEEELISLNFKNLIIFRPSILDGDRSEFRLAEILGLKFTKLFNGVSFLDGYTPTDTAKLAKMMIQVSNQEFNESTKIIEAKEIKRNKL